MSKELKISRFPTDSTGLRISWRGAPDRKWMVIRNADGAERSVRAVAEISGGVFCRPLDYFVICPIKIIKPDTFSYQCE